MSGSGAVEVSVVVVTWNNADTVPALLSSLRQFPPDQHYELIFVDNASSDDTTAFVERHRGARLIRNANNRGLAAGLNQGMAAATGRVILLCNPDIEFRLGAVSRMVATLDRHPRAAFVVPRLLYPDGRPQTSAGALPTLMEALLPRRVFSGSNRAAGFWWDGWDHREERPIGHGAECCYVVRAAAIEEIGGLDEGFWLDWEGIDWAARAAKAGWETWLCPDAEIVHVGGGSVRQAPWRWLWHSHRSMYRYFRLHSRVPAPALAIVIASRLAAKGCLHLLGGEVYGGGGRNRGDSA